MEVCVTGGTGYIASCLIRKLLEKGYSVRTTVRSTRDTNRLRVLREFPGAKERLTILRADLMDEGSYDEAMEGVQGVFHCAGPVLPPEDMAHDPQASLIEPTVKGILNVLRACAKSSTVKRVVMTSSCSAIRYDYPQNEENKILDETCWTNLDYCKENQMWYAVAKTLAEKEAWKFAEEHNLDLVVLNPSFIVGPFPTPFPSSTMLLVLYMVQGKAEGYPNQIIGFVHIDDVVDAHILVYEKPEANGRYICSSLTAHWREIMSFIAQKWPHLSVPTRASGMESAKELISHKTTSKRILDLGLKGFKTLEEMLGDTIDDFRAKGLLPLP
ncbi:hypothetical protein R1sor_020836 [Riccia sorocarpa]|uniref:NAD-dependent epimerase/dehydratase domain-containing protein n=1 Tax=Riccia sorocarpa TaxID=122646 RepID=A0ABD3GFC2_9MARC